MEPESHARPRYHTRLRKRIWQDSLAFFKRRVVPLAIALVGLIVGGLYSHFELHLTVSGQLLGSLVSILCSYLLSFLGSIVVNTLRAPWILDAESGNEISVFEQRAINAEKELNNFKKTDAEVREAHRRFAELMTQGMSFGSDLNTSVQERDFVSWDRHFLEWLNRVRDAIKNTGYSGDAVEFLRAAEAAEPVGGVMDFRYYREVRSRKLKLHQKYLAEFVQRRLPTVSH